MTVSALDLPTDLDTLGFLPGLRFRLAHRIAMHIQVTPFQMANRKPLVSFSFDDVPQSAARTGADLLSEHGAIATFFVSGSLIGQQADHWDMIQPIDLSNLVRGGHEIGCHTFGHLSIAESDPNRILDDTQANLRFLQTIEPTLTMENFAFPYGRGSFALKRKLAKSFRSSRGIVPNVNTGRIDLQFLSALPLIDRQMTPGGIDRILDQTAATNGWAIFYTHDVAPQPSPYGCSPALLAYTLTAAAARGIDCVSIRDGLDRIGVNKSPTK